jgi:hypothetical protein
MAESADASSWSLTGVESGWMPKTRKIFLVFCGLLFRHRLAESATRRIGACTNDSEPNAFSHGFDFIPANY